MKTLSVFLILMLFSVKVAAQEKLSRKELREQTKELKLKEQHLKLIEAVKDSTWGYFPYNITSSKKSGNDGGMFNFSEMALNLFNVYIPNAKNTDSQNRIPSYDAKVLRYGYDINESNDIQISLIFAHEGTNYSFLLNKTEANKWAILKLYANSKVIATYEGPLKN